MSDVAWPPSLTRTPRVANLEEKTPRVVLRSDVDVGPAKIRRRLTGGTRQFSIELDLRRTELATFDAFFITTTKGGALSFSWKNPRTGDVADFRFLDEPSYSPRAPRGDGTEWWTASFNVEMLPTGVVGTPPIEGPVPPGGIPGMSDAPVYDPFEDREEQVEEPIVGHIPRVADSVPPVFVPHLYSHFGWQGDDDSSEDEETISFGSTKEGSTTTTNFNTNQTPWNPSEP